MSPINRRTHSRGFTLVEVMLALLLMGVVLGAVTRLVRQNLTVEQSLRRQNTVRIAEDAVFDLLQRDLDGLPARQGALGIPEGLILQMQTLARFSDPQERQSSLLPAEVSYRLETHEKGNWLIREQKNLTVEKPPAQRLVLLRDVEQVNLRLHNGKQWQPATETALRKGPVALEVRLKRMESTERARVYLLQHSSHPVSEARRVGT